MRGGHLLATRDRAVVIKRCATSEVLNQFIMIETTVPYKMSLKSGSNMPPMHLRHGLRFLPGILFRYENKKWPATLLIPVFTPGMPVKLTQVQLRRHAGGRALPDDFSCRRRMFSLVWEVSQAVPAATLQIHRRHMRTRLFNACYFYHARLFLGKRRWCVNVIRKKIH